MGLDLGAGPRDVTVGLVALGTAVLVERRRRDPLVDIGELASVRLGLPLVSFLFSIIALFAVGFLLPFYFEELREEATVADIAGRLFLSEGTIRNHLSAAIQKLGAHNRAEAVRIALEKGWLDPGL